MSLRRRFSILAILAAPALLPAQQSQGPVYKPPKLPPPQGFRVYIVPDMEGMGSAVLGPEVGGGRLPDWTAYGDYWEKYRSLLTQEVNAAITGARRSGARDFVVNEGHGANRFGSTLPWELDSTAILIRGWPKPIVMSTAVDETVGTMFFTGAHANAGSPGVMSHNYAFDDFTVNGKKLNEVSINALIAGEMGVSVSLVAGDDQLVAETKEMLGNGVIGVVVKQALSRSAAITYSPAMVRRMLTDSAAVAVRREMAGDFKPLTLAKPYQVAFTLRSTFPAAVVQGVDGMGFAGLEKTGERSYRLTANDAKQIGYLLDAIEGVVIR